MKFTFRDFKEVEFKSVLNSLMHKLNESPNQWEYRRNDDQVTADIPDSFIQKLSDDELKELTDIK